MFNSILKRSQPLRDFCFALLLLGTVTFPTAIQATQSDRDISPLEPGKPVDRELAGGQSHSYRIALTLGQYLHVIVEQRDVDVAVILFGTDGKQIVQVDGPNGTRSRRATRRRNSLMQMGAK